MLERNQLPIGVAGAFMILLFPFLPMRAGSDILFGLSQGPNYYLFGRGEQYVTLLLGPLILFCVYQRAFAVAFVSLVVLLFCTLSAFLRPGSAYYGPGILHIISMFCGLILLGLSILGGWITEEPGPVINNQGRKAISKTKGATPKTLRPASFSLPSFRDVSGSIDWGWWGILVLSFIAWPVGLLLHFAFSRANDDKADAAIVGAGLGLGLMVIRFLLAMAKVGGAA